MTDFHRARRSAYLAIHGLLTRLGIFSTNRPVLVLSHFRSGSSLLNHILSSNPDILGWGELYRTYREESDFVLAELQCRKMTRQYLRRYRYTVDQVNSNTFTPVIELLDRPDVSLVFLTRNPADAAASLLTLIQDNETGLSYREVVDYYAQRYAFLASVASRPLRSRTLWLSYEALIQDTDTALAALSRFLGLHQPLQPGYRTRATAEIRRDPSEYLRSGRIQQIRHRGRPALDPADQVALDAAYHRCRQALERLSYDRYLPGARTR